MNIEYFNFLFHNNFTITSPYIVFIGNLYYICDYYH